MSAPTGLAGSSLPQTTNRNTRTRNPAPDLLSFSRDELLQNQYTTKGSRINRHRLSDAIAKKPASSPKDELLFKHYTSSSNKTNEHRFYPKGTPAPALANAPAAANATAETPASTEIPVPVAAGGKSDCCGGTGAGHVHNGAKTGNQSTGQVVERAEEDKPPVVTNGEQGDPKVEGAEAPKAVNNNTDTKPKTNETTPKNESAEKEEGGGIMKGWIKTKVLTGAALLAGGIALKMTLIGIIPGLIMAGVGSALMGWGGINYLMQDKKD
ncbi:hypothetical protein [Vampirovibrio chlorellavorus]|uniref:hypothetical protein n=1 Tax=Vampirovibrio chlorellavorus TaxID=758823 RepID=UPI0026EDF3CF|nr:hypothetical protein [Vampirovibrio chlorellavorus]